MTEKKVMNIERLKLDVDRPILIHYPADNRKVMKAEFMKRENLGGICS